MHRGKKPMPTEALKITAGFRAYRHGEFAAASGHVAGGAPVKPSAISAEASQEWDRQVRRLPWLAEADSPTLWAWCELQVQFEAAPAEFTAARITVWRQIGELLGLSPSARARIGNMNGKASDGPEKDYFGDA